MRCPWYRNDPSAAAIAGRVYEVAPDAGPVLDSELRGRRRSLRALPRARRPQRAQHRSRARGAIQRVEMDARRPARQKLVALPGRVRNAQQRLGLGVPAERVHRPRELLGNGRIAAVAEANDLVEARDRNHARDDRSLLRPLRCVHSRGARSQKRTIWSKLVIGITPGMIGTPIPASRAALTK